MSSWPDCVFVVRVSPVGEYGAQIVWVCERCALEIPSTHLIVPAFDAFRTIGEQLLQHSRTCGQVDVSENFLSVGCPICRSGPGQDCIQSSHFPLTTGDHGPEFHKERRPSAQRERQRDTRPLTVEERGVLHTIGLSEVELPGVIRARLASYRGRCLHRCPMPHPRGELWRCSLQYGHDGQHQHGALRWG